MYLVSFQCNLFEEWIELSPKMKGELNGKNWMKCKMDGHRMHVILLKLHSFQTLTHKNQTQHKNNTKEPLKHTNNVVANLRRWTLDVWHRWHRPPSHRRRHHRPWRLRLGSKYCIPSGLHATSLKPTCIQLCFNVFLFFLSINVNRYFRSGLNHDPFHATFSD